MKIWKYEDEKMNYQSIFIFSYLHIFISFTTVNKKEDHHCSSSVTKYAKDD
jgi:hypothetical protein